MALSPSLSIVDTIFKLFTSWGMGKVFVSPSPPWWLGVILFKIHPLEIWVRECDGGHPLLVTSRYRMYWLYNSQEPLPCRGRGTFFGKSSRYAINDLRGGVSSWRSCFLSSWCCGLSVCWSCLRTSWLSYNLSSLLWSSLLYSAL